MIGMIGIDPTLGYWIAKEHWGNGYMSDAVDALMHYLFQRYPIEKISTYANLDNIGSQRVLKKCGFQNVGEEDQKSPARGTIDRVYRFDALVRNTNACRLVPARVLTYATKRLELEALL